MGHLVTYYLNVVSKGLNALDILLEFAGDITEALHSVDVFSPLQLDFLLNSSLSRVQQALHVASLLLLLEAGYLQISLKRYHTFVENAHLVLEESSLFVANLGIYLHYELYALSDELFALRHCVSNPQLFILVNELLVLTELLRGRIYLEYLYVLFGYIVFQRQYGRSKLFLHSLLGQRRILYDLQVKLFVEFRRVYNKYSRLVYPLKAVQLG